MPMLQIPIEMVRMTVLLFLIFSSSCFGQGHESTEDGPEDHNLIYSDLPTTWDEGIPLGNAIIGALVWQKEKNLRLSLDRADLWDLRPMENLQFDQYNYKWVQQHWKENTYKTLQDQMDVPYDQMPAPTKIPGGALEFEIESLGQVEQVELDIHQGVCQVHWANGTSLETFVHAEQPVGFFRFTEVSNPVVLNLIPPAYTDPAKSQEEINSLNGQELQRLGYPQGVIDQTSHSYNYRQEGWNGFNYLIHVAWQLEGTTLTGAWSITSEFPGEEAGEDARTWVVQALADSYERYKEKHISWWHQFWSKSSIDIPDDRLEKQWYLELYKFGSAARDGAPPISLQAVWTADNGKIPPWKGDFHHDLNTQLSYWPAYSSNHLDLEQGFISWLWKYRDVFTQYTRDYYGVSGLNVPGVTTLTGLPMGGWIQYSLGPTVSAWLAHHFYLHWRYTADEHFLKEKAYPWIRDVAVFLDEISVKDQDGKRKLPLSSSPEIFNNGREAWFEKTTNFDLGLIRWVFSTAIEMADQLQLEQESRRWNDILNQWPDFAIDEEGGLMFAPDFPYEESHRHFSHLMAIHPLGLIDWSDGTKAQKIIRNTIDNLEKFGPGGWTGYSYSWLANLQARAFDGEGAAKSLDIFARAFCLPNSFHVNGDQLKAGYSNFTYRPFTLEGNFAFASGLQEMLIQSHTGIIHLFPAIPPHWTTIDFRKLRTEGAFLVSASLRERQTSKVEVESTMGGLLKMKNPFMQHEFRCSKEYQLDAQQNILINSEKGEKIELSRL